MNKSKDCPTCGKLMEIDKSHPVEVDGYIFFAYTCSEHGRVFNNRIHTVKMSRQGGDMIGTKQHYWVDVEKK